MSGPVNTDLRRDLVEQPGIADVVTLTDSFAQLRTHSLINNRYLVRFVANMPYSLVSILLQIVKSIGLHSLIKRLV